MNEWLSKSQGQWKTSVQSHNCRQLGHLITFQMSPECKDMFVSYEEGEGIQSVQSIGPVRAPGL